MEKLKTRSFGSRNARRQLSGFLASVLVFVFVFEQFFVSLSYGATAGNLASASDAVRSGKVSWKNSGAGEVQIAVLSDEPLYEAGDQVCLDVYIKNNTDREIDDGLLKFKAGGILEDSVYFEDIGTVYQERQEDGEGEAAGDEASNEEKAEDGKESADKTSEDGAASEEEGKDWGELSYTVSKPLTKEDADGADEEVMDGGEEEEVDLSRVTDLILEPGEIRYVQFYFTIDDEIEGNKSQTIKFTFSGKAEDKPVSAKETFRYVVGAMNLLPIGVGNEGNVAAGETARMQLDFELGDIEDEIIEREMELGVSHKAANAKIDWASASDASASDADREDDSDDASGNKLIKWDGEKADSGKKEDQPIIKNLKCTIDTPGLKLNGFKVERRGDDEYGTSTVCTFEVDENAEPGVYFGQVTASYQIKSKKFQTSQSVMLTVSNDREVEMEGLTDDPDVLEVIRLIDGLPELEEVAAKLGALEDAEDDEGYFQYIVEICELAMPVWELYQLLSEEQKEQVTNREKLEAYSVLWEVMLLIDENSITMITLPRSDWGISQDEAKKWTARTSLKFLGGWSNSWPTNGGFTAHVVGTYSDNVVAYCIEPGVSLPSKPFQPGDGYNETSENSLNTLTPDKKNLIGRIISADAAFKGTVDAGWKYTAANRKKTCKIIATQLLVWEVVVGERNADFSYHNPKPGNHAVLDIIQNHPWKDKTSTVPQDESIMYYYNQIVESVTARSKAPKFTGSTTLSWDEASQTYKTTLTDSNKVLSSIDSNGIKVNDKALKSEMTIGGTKFNFTKSGNQITISTKTRPAEKTELNIVVEKNYGKRYGLVVYSDGKNGKQDIVKHSAKMGTDDIARAEVKISIGAAKKIGITLKKTDEDGKVLEKAQFKLTKTDGGNFQAQNGTTNDQGKISFTNLVVGSYKLEETKAPAGYLKIDTPITFSIKENAKGLYIDGLTGGSLYNKTITVSNKREEASLSITKEVTSNAGQSLAPGKDSFTIHVKFGAGSPDKGANPQCDPTGNSTHTFTIKAGETVTIANIPVGTTYVITEDDADGYELVTNDPTNPLNGTIAGDGTNVSVKLVTVTNHYFKSKTTPISVRKTWGDENSSNFIKPESITVQLWRKTADAGSDRNVGTVVLDKGNNWSHNFGERDAFAAENKPYTYYIKETDIDYSNVSGYSVEPIGNGGNLFKILKEDSSVKEVKALSDKEVVGVFKAEETIDGNTRILNNTWMPATNSGNLTFSIKKINEKGEVIENGADFELYKDEACTEKAIYTKAAPSEENPNGITQFTFVHENLEIGSYYLREEKAPDGYQKLSKPLEVRVSQEFDEASSSDNISWENKWKWTATIVDENQLESDLKEIYELENSRTKISIAKTLKFDRQPQEDSKKEYQNKEYVFDIYEGTDISSEGMIVDTLTVKADGTPVSTTKLLKNGRYTIVERTENTDIPNYNWDGVTFSGTDADAASEGFQVDVDERTGEIQFTATNSYTHNLADLLIAKQVDYNDTTSYKPDPDKEFIVDVWLGAKDVEKPVIVGKGEEHLSEIKWQGEGSYTLYVKEGATAKITDIPVDMEYLIVERPVLDGSKPDTRYTFGGIVLKKETDTGNPEETLPDSTPESSEGETLPEETSVPEESVASTEPSAADGVEGDPLDQALGNGEDSGEQPSPDETEDNPPAEVPAEKVEPLFQELSGRITDHGSEKWSEEITVINHFHDRKKITIEGEKTWDLSKLDEERGLMPQSIQIDLMRKAANVPVDDEPAGQAEEESAGQEKPEAEAEVVASVEITAADDWKYSFQDLDLYAGKDAENPYEYSVVEREIRYGAEDSQEVSYLVERIEGKDMFKVSKKEPTDGFNEVLGVFRVAYDAKDAVLGEDGKTTVQEIVIDNIWEIASAINGGNAFLEVAKNDTADKKPLANATFELKVGDVTMIRTSDEEGNLNFGKAYDGEGNLLHGDLPAGTYTMTETKAPEGYQKLDTVWTVTVSKKLVDVRPLDEENPSRWVNVWEWMTDVEGDEEIGNQLTVGNDKIQGSISITKELRLDDAPNAIPANRDKEYAFGIYPGTVFTGTPVETIVVKADGIAVSSGLLDYGVYTIAEIRRSDIDGFDWAGVTFGGAEDADKDAAGFQVMIAGQDETLAVTATNWYSPKEEESTTPREEETTTAPEESSSEEETTAPEESSSEEETTTPEETTTQPESSSAEETTAPTPFRGGGNGGGGGGGTGRDRERTVTENIGDEDVPLVNINPEDVPLANLPNEPVAQAPLEILDEDVPLVGLAKTGDRSVPIGVLVGLMMVSLLGALGVSRKRKEDENS